MATNKPAGDGHRNGAVRKRSQLKGGVLGKETKRDLTTGQFMDQKKDGSFKGVRKEHESVPKFYIELRDKTGIVHDEEGAEYKHVEDALN